jgi:poly-gamma-glutamate synthesis protein (capsule biosynthesis protein)
MQPAAVTVSLVGDVVLRTPLARLRREDDQGFDAAVAELQAADLVLANLEIPLSRRGYRVPKMANLRADPEIIHEVRALGIDAVALANNHMMDYGPEAMLDTLAACDQAGIARCGAGVDLDAALEPARLEINGRRIALLNLSCTLPAESEAAPGKPGIAPLHVVSSYEVDPGIQLEQPGTMPVVHTWARPEDQERACRLVGSLREQADTVIVAMHWGAPSHWLSPYQGLLAEYQTPLGHALIEAGADVVWGHHSHELDPIELYRGRLIFYGLGHFLLEEPWDFMRPESVIARLTLAERPALELVPLHIDARGLPRLVTGDAAAGVLRQIAERSALFGTRLRIADDRAEVILERVEP